MAEEQEITLRQNVRSTVVHGDSDRISQAITNLLINAIQHTPRSGGVALRVGRDEASAFVEVSDTGPGIAAKDLPHIFERFYRADQARTSIAGRTGLGLSIAKAIIEAHGGSITGESEPGMGAKFIIRLR
jgi:two-component system OmpR family sensor kinase